MLHLIVIFPRLEIRLHMRILTDNVEVSATTNLLGTTSFSTRPPKTHSLLGTLWGASLKTHPRQPNHRRTRHYRERMSRHSFSSYEPAWRTMYVKNFHVNGHLSCDRRSRPREASDLSRGFVTPNRAIWSIAPLPNSEHLVKSILPQSV